MADAQVLAKYPERKASRKQVIADSLMCKNNGKITQINTFLRLL